MASDRAGVLSYVAVDQDPLTHAMLTVDAQRGRTVCGRTVAQVLVEAPAHGLAAEPTVILGAAAAILPA